MNAAKLSWRWLQTNVRKLAQFCIFVLAAGLLLLEAHDAVELTWKSISLVTILTIVAVLNDLEKIDFGDFGGVRFRDEIAEVERRVERLETPRSRSAGVDGAETSIAVESLGSSTPTSAEKRSTGAGGVVTTDAVGGDGDDGLGNGAAETDAAADRLYELLEREPRAALSQLRIELERAQRRAVGAAPDQRTGRPIDDGLVAAALEVRSLCRTAVHDADDLDRTDAARVIDLGLRVLDRLLAANGTDETARTEEPDGADGAR